jgi:tellurite resistance protein TerB
MKMVPLGGNVSLMASETRISVTLQPQSLAGAEVDLSAFLLAGNGRVRGDDDMVFYGQRSPGNGAVSLLSAEAGRSLFRLDLPAIDSSIDKVVLTATIDPPSTKFSSFNTLQLILDGQPEQIGVDLPCAGRSESALILGECYRRNGQWKFRAVGQGFNGGLQPLAEHLGVDISTPDQRQQPAAPPPAPPAAPPPPSSVPPSPPAAAPAPSPTATDAAARPPQPPSAPATGQSPPPHPAAAQASAGLSWLKGNVRAARDRLTSEVARFKNREFMEAVVAGCALVAAADGEINPEEKRKMIGFIQHSDELKVFDLGEVIDTFNRVTDKFAFDQTLGRAEALRLTGKLRSKPDAARLMVRVCCAVGSADGQFDQDERIACRLICEELDLNPADFDL